MRTAPQFEFSEEQCRALWQARRLEYLTLAYIVTVVILMYLVMGGSQAMKTAWIEDALSIVPPLAFLISSYLCWRKPNQHFPYGYHRIASINFLIVSLTLLSSGLYIALESIITLVMVERASIGMQEFAGYDLWLGWWMMPVLLWSTVPPLFLGRIKMRLAKTLNDKILYTDAESSKANWLTSLTAGFGVIGIGMGWWWSDAVAAIIISLDIIYDGAKQTADAFTGLMNRAPTDIEDNYDPLPERIKERLEAQDWIDKAEVRLYEQGHLIFGEGFIITDKGRMLSSERLLAMIEEIERMDWRLQGFALTVAEPNA